MESNEMAFGIQQRPPNAQELRELVLGELRALGFRHKDGRLTPERNDKEFRRGLHAPAREAALSVAAGWLSSAWEKYRDSFAQGYEVRPELTSPQLIEVETKEQRELFRLARYTWSLPYTKGYGRRLQFLIKDGANDKLVGILGMQSPPLSFPARDHLFAYPDGRKTELINQTMDIYTLGAVQPYARLLGAKLIALASASNQVRDAYRRRYSDRVTEMQGRQLPAHLVALTTTSAFGRSSIYNRLHYCDVVRFQSIGFTDGYGAFHLDRLYPRFRQFLEAEGVDTRGGFGKGPRIKWQTMTRTLDRIGLSRELLRHNVQREAFLIPLIHNLENYLNGDDTVPGYIDVSFQELATYWRERWLLPRAERVDGWRSWEKERIAVSLTIE